MKNSISIILVNYNGRHLLEECMPTIIDSAIFSNLKYEIIVIDNASTDDSLYFLMKRYPFIITISMKVNNRWFAINEGIEKSSYDHLFLLNNDIKLERRCIKYLFEHFDKDNNKTFAATPKEFDWNGIVPIVGAQYLEKINENYSPSRKSFFFDKAHITFNAGNAMYAKDKLIKLGLFDQIFSPFYYEDVDMSYRAWKAGLEIIYEPKAVIYHKSGATIDKYITLYCQRKYGFKNTLLFVWKDITDRDLFFEHIILLMARLIRSLLFLKDKGYIFSGFVLALGSLKQVFASRRKALKNFILRDKEVLNKLGVKNFYEEN